MFLEMTCTEDTYSCQEISTFRSVALVTKAGSPRNVMPEWRTRDHELPLVCCVLRRFTPFEPYHCGGGGGGCCSQCDGTRQIICHGIRHHEYAVVLTPYTTHPNCFVDTRRFFTVVRMIDVTVTSNLVMFGESESRFRCTVVYSTVEASCHYHSVTIIGPCNRGYIYCKMLRGDSLCMLCHVGYGSWADPSF